MKNYIMVNGHKFETDDSLSPTTNFTQIEGQIYYYISGGGDIFSDVDSNTDASRTLYKVANYCTNKSLIEQRALHEILNRLLWRFNEMHGGDVQWDGDKEHFYIFYNEITNKYIVGCYAHVKAQGVIYFPSLKLAQEAIETVVKPFVAKHPDFVW